jgi:(p)ppGpp synthase/HD superfamily hydrolase
MISNCSCTKKRFTFFTPKGELKILPAAATALDFAYTVHTNVGDNCIGAKVNNKLVPISHELKKWRSGRNHYFEETTAK